ncbi:DUF4336 domain-containing protein [Paraburkholderia sediminicola]|uniref:DUF4336 domain-containing protein n=1 Tax=Paraburkholderia sediminicola TaxID=458836 RepID=UPI0038BA41FB
MDNRATPTATYPPLDTMKEVAQDVWVVDGPAIRFGVPCFRMAFPTRMTIVRTPGRKLFIHSPTRLTASLEAAVAQVGTPRWLIGPNRLHLRWLQDWAAAYPDALVYSAPGGEDKMSYPRGKHRLPLNGITDYEWEPDLATLPVAGRHFTEIVFFHRSSRTLILTDLIENFEVERLDSRVARVLTLVGGVRHPDGQMPRDMRLLFALPSNRNDLKLAVEKMIGWDPERVILAHGRWYDTEGTAELRRAFRWLIRQA